MGKDNILNKRNCRDPQGLTEKN